MSAAEEVWRDVLGYEGSYRVSDQGRVMSLVAKKPGLIMALHASKARYLIVQLKVGQRPETRLVHTLVDEAFNGPRVPGLEVNHKDGDKSNAALSNLERVTRSENMVHAFSTGLKASLKGEGHGRARVSAEQVGVMRAMAGAPGANGRFKYGMVARLSEAYGLSRSAISSILHRANWSHLA
jgi:hypothetical protein